MEWKLVHRAQGDAEALVVKSFLESNDIKVRQTKESIGRLDMIQVSGLGQVELYVAEKDYEEAKELLAEFSEPSSEGFDSGD